MKVQTQDLTGPALNWAVNQIEECCDDPCTPRFSTDWLLGGPIIEREGITVQRVTDALWDAYCQRIHRADGPTPLIAAMRCYVASVLGDTVEVPENLVLEV